MRDEVLTVEKVGALLKVRETTVCAKAPAGAILALKVRGQWRIKRPELDQWTDAQARGGDSGGGGADGR